MDSNKRERLEAAGWKIGSAQDFLGLSGEEAAFVELKASPLPGGENTRLEHRATD